MFFKKQDTERRYSRLKKFILKKLCCHYRTPEQIAGWLTHRQKALPFVSHETIYGWLYQKEQKKENLWKFLPRRKGQGKSCTPQRVSIHEHPKIETKKAKDFAHREGGLMVCRKNYQRMLVLRKRKSMMTLSMRLENKKAKTTIKTLRELIKDIPPQAGKTITFDNGREFSGHYHLFKELGVEAFFCDPYTSWPNYPDGAIKNDCGI